MRDKNHKLSLLQPIRRDRYILQRQVAYGNVLRLPDRSCYSLLGIVTRAYVYILGMFLELGRGGIVITAPIRI